MKIAFVCDDGTTIHRHFGRARQYVIVTIEDGRETSREIRAKSACHGHDHAGSPQAHHDAAHHDALLAVIADCQMVVAGGMGAGMDERLRGGGITPIRTRILAIDTAVERYLSGRLTDTIELVH
ncbi:MAG: NifB/NifX family molybdenum-iron cluster-binding protein [Chloroflexales bacterium]